jgi:hypothetical protein
MAVSPVRSIVNELYRGDVLEHLNQKGLSESMNQRFCSIHGPAKSIEEPIMFIILHQGSTLLLSISKFPQHAQNTSVQKGNEDNVVDIKSLS